MKFKGLTPSEVEESRRKHGSNVLTQIPLDPLWKKILIGLRDPMIIILIVALLVQLVLFFIGQAEWYEPFGVFVAIMIADCVSAVSEFRQERKASALKEEEVSSEISKVVREGRLIELHSGEIVCGDIVYLQAGDKIPADGEIVDGELKVNQASLNGENEDADKLPPPEGTEYDEKDLFNRHYVYRGTVVCDGYGYMRAKVVGDSTLFGKLALEVQSGTRESPLQVKLRKLAGQISVFAYIGASAIVLGILLRTFITGSLPADVYKWISLIMDAVTVAVTVIVCAVPEGLPMLTSILLSFQSIRMAKDNVLVRKINGLETAGSLNILFSDKTGTITEGRLSVVEMASGDACSFKSLSDVGPALAGEVKIGIGLNNSSAVSEGKVIGGNSTDRALLSYLVSEGAADAAEKRGDVLEFSAFDSKKKMSTLLLNREGKAVSYVKGAPERIVDLCSKYLDRNGNEAPFEDRDRLLAYMDEKASCSMRLLGVARTEGGDLSKDLTLICVICIRDNVRKEAVDSIRDVKAAGIQVVMVTGDRKETAVAIARDAGLLSGPDDVAMTSAELAAKTDDELKAILPRLRVVSRALPLDKSRLVRIAQELNLVVGMTGDGVNDSPALKKADVGFAMGSGTEVAKDAGDITILDDNFLSIEKAILYGRTMFRSIRKFLLFQLTVNIAAVLICFIGPLLGENVILTVIQLLLINLTMDSLAAIAFGSEPALKEYMKDRPVPRSENIITGEMFFRVVFNSLYITLVCLGILFLPSLRGLFGNVDVVYLKSAVFATFMMAITFNGFNARTRGLNPFKGIMLNRNFIVVMMSIFAMQYLFVMLGGRPLRVEPLTWSSWCVCALLAVAVIPIDMVCKSIIALKSCMRERK